MSVLEKGSSSPLKVQSVIFASPPLVSEPKKSFPSVNLRNGNAQRPSWRNVSEQKQIRSDSEDVEDIEDGYEEVKVPQANVKQGQNKQQWVIEPAPFEPPR